MPRRRRNKEVDARATAIAREAWAVPSTHASVYKRARVPAELAEVYQGQTSAERGATWAQGQAVQAALPYIIDLAKERFDLGDPSYITSSHDITVVWGRHSAIAPTATQAILKIIQEVSGNEAVQTR